MIIKSIKLKNIRSYLDQSIDFPQGSTLLAGDVGSGKSSILLAIDFALFGLKKGSLSGSSLLRNGRDFGFVQLDFSIDNSEVTIKRSLKRSNSSITQDSGFIMINGVRKEGTALELKQAILDLLHYPSELLTKSKSLIFRYTVYTPQEEMKQILTGDTDLRLDTLRRVFGIDKYKRVKENSKIFSSKLRERMKEFAGSIADLDLKLAELKTNNEKLLVLDGQVAALTPKVLNLKALVNSKKEELSVVESDLKALEVLKKEYEFADFDFKAKSKQLSDLKADLSLIDSEISRIASEVVEPLDLDSILVEIKAKQGIISNSESEISSINHEISVAKTKMGSSSFIKDSISKLDTCPTCKQNVSDEHKKHIDYVESVNIADLSRVILEFSEKKALKESDLSALKNSLDILRSNVSKAEVLKLKKSNLIEKEFRKAKLSEQLVVLENSLSSLSLMKFELSGKIAVFPELEIRFKKVKEDLDLLISDERGVEIEKVSLETEARGLRDLISVISSDIDRKTKVKDKLVNLSLIHDWVDGNFLSLMDVIEKNILLRVYADFDSFFQKWFDMIIDNPSLKVKLNDDFSPLIVQDGHEMDYAYLSGGEKTAAALAYRLALNQVINNLMSDIRTRDLIILDEPTDGFSSEQLDRVNSVLDELNVKQIIIVSHEAKIESFVDHVVRLNKSDHVSNIV